MKLSKHEVYSLILLTLIPFILIVGSLYPYANGIHGTTHSEAWNEYEFKGNLSGDVWGGVPIGPAHFKGDLYVGDNTGWIICNGKIRFCGELTVKNAEFDCTYREEDYYGSFFGDHDCQEITIDGDKGEMKEGFPFYFIGFFGSMIGFFIWLGWYISKREIKYGRQNVLFAIIFGVLSLTVIGFDRICLIIFIITIPLGLLMYRSFKKYSFEQKSWFIGVSIIIGFIILVVSILSFACPNHYGLGGMEYSKSTALRGIFVGIIGSIASADLIGFGCGKITASRRVKQHNRYFD